MTRALCIWLWQAIFGLAEFLKNTIQLCRYPSTVKRSQVEDTAPMHFLLHRPEAHTTTANPSVMVRRYTQQRKLSTAPSIASSRTTMTACCLCDSL